MNRPQKRADQFNDIPTSSLPELPVLDAARKQPILQCRESRIECHDANIVPAACQARGNHDKLPLSTAECQCANQKQYPQLPYLFSAERPRLPPNQGPWKLAAPPRVTLAAQSSRLDAITQIDHSITTCFI